jgi:rapamycin-insensitive companion of mTOR
LHETEGNDSAAAADVETGDQSDSSIAQSATGQAEFIGICLPADISVMFQMNEMVEEQTPATNEDETEKVKCGCAAASQQDAVPLSSQPTKADDGLDHHSLTMCLVCWSHSSLQSHAAAAVSQFDSGQQTDDEVLNDCATVRREILRLVIKTSSSVGLKSCEQGLLILKQKFPSAFQDICLYSEICYLLANYNYRLNARRFIQELFQDIDFRQCLVDPQLVVRISAGAADDDDDDDNLRTKALEALEQLESDF